VGYGSPKLLRVRDVDREVVEVGEERIDLARRLSRTSARRSPRKFGSRAGCLYRMVEKARAEAAVVKCKAPRTRRRASRRP